MSVQNLLNHLEVQGGVLSQVDAMRHMSLILSVALQERMVGSSSSNGKSEYVSLTFSVVEIDRLIWLASELLGRSQTLHKLTDAVYDELSEMFHDEVEATAVAKAA